MPKLNYAVALYDFYEFHIEKQKLKTLPAKNDWR